MLNDEERNEAYDKVSRPGPAALRAPASAPRPLRSFALPSFTR